MARFSIRSLNKELEPAKLELVKGQGYFYFADTDANDLRCARLNSTSVPVFSFNQLSPAEWRAEAEHIIRQIENNKKEI